MSRFIDDLDRILNSISKMCEISEVPVITGDTKVVERGAVEKLFTNTSGIGKRTQLIENNIKEVKNFREFNERWLKDSNLQNGDIIICSGTVGDHGVALLSFREGYGFESKIQSDIYPLNKMIAKALNIGGIVAIKDPTRGGLANTLNEWSEKSKIGILIEEDKIPIREEVRSACEMLGIEPLNIGNEGKAVFGVVKEKAEDILKVLKRTREGKEGFGVGIGINTGSAIVGNVGSHNRMNYTAIGDSINIAARLQENAKSGKIIVGKETYYQTKGYFKVEKKGNVMVKNRVEPLEYYTILR